MGRAVLHMSVSVDGFFEGLDGDISWHRVDEELHQHFNDTLRRMTAFVEGRRTYELMEAYWPTADDDPGSTGPEREFAEIWRETPKVVVSRTLTEVGPNARLVQEVDPDEVHRMTARGDIAVGGAELAATFLDLGLIDELRLYVHPVVLGQGRPLLPAGTAIDLDLLEAVPFGNGVVLLRYEVSRRVAA